MAVEVLSALVAASCVLASARRLAWAIGPTSLEPTLLAAALKRSDSGGPTRASEAEGLWTRLRAVVVGDEQLGWDRDLFVALGVGDAVARDALVNEQLIELERRAERWARVPRVCASIATSAGFFFASIALSQGLSIQGDVGDSAATRGAMIAALNALTIGIAGTSFCAAVHLRARRVLRERLAAVERLVDRLRALASAEADLARLGPAGPAA